MSGAAHSNRVLSFSIGSRTSMLPPLAHSEAPATLDAANAAKENCWVKISILYDAQSLVLAINPPIPSPWEYRYIIIDLLSIVHSFDSFCVIGSLEGTIILLILGVN